MHINKNTLNCQRYSLFITTFFSHASVMYMLSSYFFIKKDLMQFFHMTETQVGIADGFRQFGSILGSALLLSIPVVRQKYVSYHFINKILFALMFLIIPFLQIFGYTSKYAIYSIDFLTGIFRSSFWALLIMILHTQRQKLEKQQNSSKNFKHFLVYVLQVTILAQFSVSFLVAQSFISQIQIGNTVFIWVAYSALQWRSLFYQLVTQITQINIKRLKNPKIVKIKQFIQLFIRYQKNSWVYQQTFYSCLYFISNYKSLSRSIQQCQIFQSRMDIQDMKVSYLQHLIFLHYWGQQSNKKPMPIHKKVQQIIKVVYYQVQLKLLLILC